jgi:hypothetical protein
MAKTRYCFREGTVVQVEHCWGGYMLPEGLEPGTLVKVIHFHMGYYEVEDASEKRWTVFMVNLKPLQWANVSPVEAT